MTAIPPVVDASSDEPPAPRRREKLSQTGLYTDIAAKTLAANVVPYEPAHALWSDGALKTRWIHLPPGTSIDASDPDHFKLPLGGQLFKEFSQDGKRLETRLVERVASTGKDETDYWLGAFLWRDDESDADFVVDGAKDVRGTLHDVPSAETCWACHIGEPGHVLGFSALQLSHDHAGLNLAAMRNRGIVPGTVTDAPSPSNAVARAATGYLHANCGHCHNVNGAAWPDTDMVLRLGYGESDLENSKLVRSTVGHPLNSYQADGYTLRIDPGQPDTSAIVHRMSIRADAGAMPPIATEVIDPVGIEGVRTWIASMPRDAGSD